MKRIHKTNSGNLSYSWSKSFENSECNEDIGAWNGCWSTTYSWSNCWSGSYGSYGWSVSPRSTPWSKYS